jgi:hypothetical protein
MKKLYFFLTAFLFAFNMQAQDVNTYSLEGTCLNPDDGTIDIVIDMNKNCPEADPNGVLPGTMEMGLHAGANVWASVVAWDDANAIIPMNNGNDSFLLTINTMDYWGVAFADMTDIQMVLNNGIADPADPWTLAVRDTLNGGFGGNEPCSDLKIFFDQTPTCQDLAQESSLALFSDAGDSESCVDADGGLVRIDLDYDQACPEGDSAMLLVGAAELGFHSGANDWASVVAWDDPGAVKLVNDGNDNFSAVIDVEAYYGIAYADLMNIQIVANNGPSGGAPWDNVLKDPRNGGFGGNEPCSDIRIFIAEAPACDLTGTKDIELQHSFKVTPNPFHNRTFLEFDNPNNRTFELVITNMSGQTVRAMNNITGERVLIEREGLPTGMYIANLIDENGNFATTKLVVK